MPDKNRQKGGKGFKLSSMENGGGIAIQQGAIKNSGRTGRFIATGQLTDMEAIFVRRIVRNGGEQTSAARDAGYSDPARRAHELVRKPHIIEAIRQERQRYIETDLANIAAGTMRDLLTDDSTPRAVQFQAARWCLEQSGKDSDNLRDLLNGSKSLNDMTIEELNAFIGAGSEALKELETARHRVIDITPDSAPVSAQLDEVPDVLS